MLTEGLYQATDAEIESPTLPRPHSVHLEAVAFKSEQKRRFTGLYQLSGISARLLCSVCNIPFRASHRYKTLCNHMRLLLAKCIQ